MKKITFFVSISFIVDDGHVLVEDGALKDQVDPAVHRFLSDMNGHLLIHFDVGDFDWKDVKSYIKLHVIY